MKKVRFGFAAFFAAFFIGISCAGGGIKANFLKGYESADLEQINISSVDADNLLKKIRELNKKVIEAKTVSGSYDYDNIIRGLEDIFMQYKSLEGINRVADYNDAVLLIPPKSSVSMKVKTYCLDSGKASPKKDEPYVLFDGEPDIAMFKDIMKYTNSKETVKQSLKQKLLWNLQNHVRYERLSGEERKLLNRIDSNAYLRVDNFFKDAAGSLLKELIPGWKEAEKVSRIVKGTVYKYEDYKRNVMSLVSKHSIPEVAGPIKSDGYDVYTIVEPEGFSKAKITFINLTDKTQKINSYFRPLRNDVQPLAFDLPVYIDNTLENKIRKEIGELIILSVEFISGSRAKLYDDYIAIKIGKGDRVTIEDNPERIIDFWKAMNNRNKAFKLTKKVCEENPGMCSKNMHNCNGDAFRHAMWNALMQRDIGDYAEIIATNHERNIDNSAENNMDLFNNKIGRNIGKKLKEKGIIDDDSYCREVLDSIDKMKYLK